MGTGGGTEGGASGLGGSAGGCGDGSGTMRGPRDMRAARNWGVYGRREVVASRGLPEKARMPGHSAKAGAILRSAAQQLWKETSGEEITVEVDVPGKKRDLVVRQNRASRSSYGVGTRYDNMLR